MATAINYDEKKLLKLLKDNGFEVLSINSKEIEDGREQRDDKGHCW